MATTWPQATPQKNTVPPSRRVPLNGQQLSDWVAGVMWDWGATFLHQRRQQESEVKDGFSPLPLHNKGNVLVGIFTTFLFCCSFVRGVCVCVCVRACARARACVRACVRACMRACVRV